MTAFPHYPITFDGETVNVGTANELAVALDVLQGQHDRETLVQLRDHLPEIIRNASGLLLILKSLSVEDAIYLIEQLGASLVDVLQKAYYLRDLLAVMADPRIECALLTTLGSRGLRQLIVTGGELAEVLEWVYGDEDRLLLDLLGVQTVRSLCRHAADLGAILKNVDFSLQEEWIQNLGWEFVTSLVRDARDLAILLRALPPQHSARLLQQFTGQQLVALVGNASQWTYLTQRLEPAELKQLSDILRLQAN